jgi:hypothetical protein
MATLCAPLAILVSVPTSVKINGSQNLDQVLLRVHLQVGDGDRVGGRRNRGRGTDHDLAQNGAC